MPLYLAGKYNNKFYLCNSRDKKTDITPFSERIQNVCRKQRRTYLLVGKKYAAFNYQWLNYNSVSVDTLL